MAEYDGDAAWAELSTAVDQHLRSEALDPAVVARLAAAAVAAPLRWTGTMHLLPDFADLHLRGRTVELSVDGDWRSNLHVASSAERFALALEAIIDELPHGLEMFEGGEH